MKKTLILAAAAILAVSCFHVNSNYKGGKNTIVATGPVVSRTYDLKDFKAIRLAGGSDVTFSQADSFRVVLRTQESVVDSVECKVIDGELYVGTKDHRPIRAKEFSLDIAAPVLTRVLVQGATDFSIPHGYSADENLSFKVEGAADIDLNSVSCKGLSFHIQGAGDVSAKDVDVKTCLKVKVEGAGDITVSGRTLDALMEVSGAGDIDIRHLTVEGNIRRKTAGAARIRQ